MFYLYRTLNFVQNRGCTIQNILLNRHTTGNHPPITDLLTIDSIPFTFITNTVVLLLLDLFPVELIHVGDIGSRLNYFTPKYCNKRKPVSTAQVSSGRLESTTALKGTEMFLPWSGIEPGLLDCRSGIENYGIPLSLSES